MTAAADIRLYLHLKHGVPVCSSSSFLAAAAAAATGRSVDQSVFRGLHAAAISTQQALQVCSHLHYYAENR
jgi:hypothetical protein